MLDETSSRGFGYGESYQTTPKSFDNRIRGTWPMRTIGRHLLAELYSCDCDTLSDITKVRQLMLIAAEDVGATVVGDVFHEFSPRGVSGVVVIAESHLSIHTWPDSRYVAIDIYTCGNLDPLQGLPRLASSLGAQEYRVQEILRGLPGELVADTSRLPRGTCVITSMTGVQNIRNLNQTTRGRSRANAATRLLSQVRS